MTTTTVGKVSVHLFLKALFLGVVAMFLASLVGAFVLSLFVVSAGVTDYFGIIAPALFYGLIAGPLIAWPVTLIILPIAWLLAGDRLPAKPVLFALLGAVSGAICVQLIGPGVDDVSVVDNALITAGLCGGAAAGLLFGLLLHGPLRPRPAAPV